MPEAISYWFNFWKRLFSPFLTLEKKLIFKYFELRYFVCKFELALLWMVCFYQIYAGVNIYKSIERQANGTSAKYKPQTCKLFLVCFFFHFSKLRKKAFSVSLIFYFYICIWNWSRYGFNHDSQYIWQQKW